MRLIVVSLGTARQAQIEEDVARALEDGLAVDLVVTKADPWADLPAEVTRHVLGDLEANHPVLRAERFVVLRLPRLVYEFGRRSLAVLAKVAPGPIGVRVRGLQGAWKRRWIVVREAITRFHKERWGGLYGQVRPFVLWRTARRRVLPGLGEPELIVVGDGLSSPTGWHLVRRFPGAGIGSSLDEARDDRARATG